MATFKSLTCEALHQQLAHEDILLIDIRDPQSYAEGHIQHAQNLQKDQLDQFIEQTDKTTTIICYCYRGMSSQVVASLLFREGFEQVASLEGGFTAWQEHYPDDIISE